MTPYTDLVAAQAKGEVDTYLSYKVKFGTPDITNVGKLKSGNAYLQRRFTLTLADGTEVKKPKLSDWWVDGAVWGVKQLSARTKLDAVDEVSFPIYEDFITGYMGDKSNLVDVLEQAHADVGAFKDAIDGGGDRDECVAVFKEALRKVNNALDVIYEGEVCPAAFYVGATGLVPDAYGAAAMTADQLVEKHPNVKLAKAEKEGTFYEVTPGLLLGVFVKAEHFSTASGVAQAAALAA